MTIMEQTDIEKQVKWLLDNRDFSFTSSTGSLMQVFGEMIIRDEILKIGPR